MSGLTAELVALDDPSTPIATCELRRTLDFQEIINDTGAFSITFENADPALGTIDPPNTLINIYTDGNLAVTGILESFEATKVSQNDEADLVTKWHGRLHVALLDRALIYPALALGSLPVEEDRGFNVFATIYDEAGAGMVPATQLCTVLDAQTGSWPIPWDSDFADTGAQVLGPSSGSTSTAPTGACYIRAAFAVPFFGTWEIQILGDNYGDVSLDGAHIVSFGLGNGIDAAAEGFTKKTTYRAVLSAGLHLLAASVTNIAIPPSNVDDPIGFAFTVVTVDPNGTLGPVIASSDASIATIAEYPPEIPGMTPGAILLREIDEAQNGTALGGGRATGDSLAAINLINPTFDASVDTAGNPWPTLPDYATKIGTSILTSARELATAGYIDFSFTPGTLDFNAWIAGGRGSITAVDFHSPTNPDDESTGNLVEHHERGEIPIADALLVRTDLGWSERTSPGAIASVGRIEAALSLGAQTSLTETNRIADAQLGEFDHTRAETTIAITPLGPDDTPYAGIFVGDTITVEGDPHRVLGFSVTEDDNGNVIYVPTLNDAVVLSWEERAALWFRKMVPMSLGGRSAAAQPFVPHWTPRGFPLPAGPTFFYESFDKSDGPLGPNLAWSVIYGTADDLPEVYSNTFSPAQTGGSYSLGGARADADVGSPDMYVEVTVAAIDSDPPAYTASTDIQLFLRMEAGSPVSSHQTWYFVDFAGAVPGSWGAEVWKVVAGLPTQLGGTESIADVVAGQVLRAKVVGSTITGYVDGVAVITRTDSSIASGSLGGVSMQFYPDDHGSRLDDFIVSAV